MSTQVCQEHGADVVVYQADYRSSCPLCTANTEVDDLKQQGEGHKWDKKKKSEEAV